MPDTPAKPATLDDILAELTAIRLILASRPTPPPQARTSSPAPATSSTGANVGDEPIPQPGTIITNAGDVQIHFGKNSGKPLSEINERSLSWYAAEQPPRLGNNGKPFPPRQQDLTLKDAARTLWHTNRGTLATGLYMASAPPASAPKTHAAPTAASTTARDDEENVPF